MMSINYICFKQPSQLWKDAAALRYEVFVKEQGVPDDMEIDTFDASAHHLIAYDGEVTVGVLRIVLKDEFAKIGRVAVNSRYRRQGIGTEMMRRALAFCHLRELPNVILNSQLYMTHFYTKLGFVREGDEFMDAGILHVRMVLHLEKVAKETLQLPLFEKDSDRY